MTDNGKIRFEFDKATHCLIATFTVKPDLFVGKLVEIEVEDDASGKGLFKVMEMSEIDNGCWRVRMLHTNHLN